MTNESKAGALAVLDERIAEDEAHFLSEETRMRKVRADLARLMEAVEIRLAIDQSDDRWGGEDRAYYADMLGLDEGSSQSFIVQIADERLEDALARCKGGAA